MVMNLTLLVHNVRPRASAVAERLWSAQNVTDVNTAQYRLDQQRCRMLRYASTKLVTFQIYFQVLDHSFILETNIAPLQETTSQKRSQSSHGQIGDFREM